MHTKSNHAMALPLLCVLILLHEHCLTHYNAYFTVSQCLFINDVQISSYHVTYINLLLITKQPAFQLMLELAHAHHLLPHP